MRVLHICAYYAPAYVYGGPVRSIHALCRAQQQAGLDIEVLTTTAAGPRRLPAAPEGRDVDGVRVRYFELSSPAMLLGSADLPAALTPALHNADVVHVHGLFNRTVWQAGQCLRLSARPHVLSPRGMLEAPALAHHRWRKRLTWHLQDRAIVHRAAVLHATSSAESQTLRDAFPTQTVVEIPNPVNAPPVDEIQAMRWRAAHGVPAGAPMILSLGRLHRIKRLDLVASSFLALKQEVPGAHLVIAGPDEQQLRPRLEAVLAGVRDAVHWIDQVAEDAKWPMLRAATVLVQCSDSESFGMSIAEALASGTPVVVTRTCPWREIEVSGCGFWVDQRADAIASALTAVVSNRELAREQGAAGQRLIRERMLPARVARAWHAVYREAARSGFAAA
jgi:glycosyltransferase involved in cell wall biosynthesis